MISIKKRPEEFHSELEAYYDKEEGNVRNITFQVTDRCNMACTYCYQINKGTRRMSFETAKKAVDLILSGEKGFKEYLGKVKGVILEFIGGEPFLETELMDKIIDYFRLRCIETNNELVNRFKVSISSNVTLWKNKEVQDFLDKHKNHLSYGVSIDGNKQLHDSCRVFSDGSPTYDIAIGAVENWRQKGMNMSSKMTFAPANIKYTYEALKNMVELNYDEINANCVFEPGWKLEDATTYYYELKKFADYMIDNNLESKVYFSIFSYDNYTSIDPAEDKNFCGGDGQMLAIDPDGKLYPCLRYMESSLGTTAKPLIIGDVDRGIGTTSCDKNCLNCLKGVTRSSQSTEECFNCPIAQGCSWCSALNYQLFGTLHHRTTYTCDMHRAQSLANCYFINRLNKERNDSFRLEIKCPKDKAINIIGEDEYIFLENLSK